MPKTHYEGAPAWYITAARDALRDIPDALRMTGTGVGAFILHSGQEGRVSVGVALATARTTYYDRPRNPRARAAWGDARDRIRAVLTDVGFSDITDTIAGLNATAPEPHGPLVEVEVTRSPDLTVVGVYTVHIVGHPHLFATIDGGFHHGVTSGSGGYRVTGSAGQPIGGSYATPFEAARDYAAHCGFPPVTVKENR